MPAVSAFHQFPIVFPIPYTFHNPIKLFNSKIHFLDFSEMNLLIHILFPIQRSIRTRTHRLAATKANVFCQTVSVIVWGIWLKKCLAIESCLAILIHLLSLFVVPTGFCSPDGTQIPGRLEPNTVPQMIMISFDDAVNNNNIEIYNKLFKEGRNNPNGCSIKSTFFISHKYTNYSAVQELHRKGSWSCVLSNSLDELDL